MQPTFQSRLQALLPLVLSTIADASTTQINYTSGQSQFPVFTVNSASSTISITSAIPINYVPKYISFTVTNGQGLSLSAYNCAVSFHIR